MDSRALPSSAMHCSARCDTCLRLHVQRPVAAWCMYTWKGLRHEAMAEDKLATHVCLKALSYASGVAYCAYVQGSCPYRCKEHSSTEDKHTRCAVIMHGHHMTVAKLLACHPKHPMMAFICAFTNTTGRLILYASPASLESPDQPFESEVHSIDVANVYWRFFAPHSEHATIHPRFVLEWFICIRPALFVHDASSAAITALHILCTH